MIIVCFIAIALLCTCCGSRPSEKAEIQKERAETSLLVLSDTVRADTFTLNRIADTVFYVNLHRKFRGEMKVHYSDSIILMQDSRGIYAFDASGKMMYAKDAYLCCFDVDAEAGKFFTYESTFGSNEVKAYDFKGKELYHFRVLADGASGYSNRFFALSDSLFVKANSARDENELVFFNRKGRAVKRIKNPEVVIPSPGAYTHNEVWPRPLFRSPMGLRFHRCYGDTLFAVEADRTLRPVFVEHLVKKVPYDKRLEVVGGDQIAYHALCDKEGYAATRVYENSRFFLIEYLVGKSESRMPGYWLYDREEGTLSRAGITLKQGMEAHTFHFGIFNDYDGGLGFAPLCQSGDYLIMVNAGTVQPSSFSNCPKYLYEKGRELFGETYACRSDVAASAQKEAAVKAFFRDFDDEKDTMLMIVKLKK